MSETAALVEAMKREIHRHGHTYKDVARALGMSEASIKRMFSRRTFTLERIEAICEFLDIGFADLVRRLRAVAREFSLLQDEDALLALEQRAGVGLMLGLRALEFAPFEALRRPPG